jgi:phosphate transport system substrate-binding protein
LLLALGMFSGAGQAADAVRVRGSTTFLPFVRSVGEDYMVRNPTAAIVVSGGGSARGYKALLDDTADVAMVSGPLPDALRREFERRQLRLAITTVGYKPLVAVVHPSNPLNDISLRELGAMFSGRIASWPQGNMRGAAIRVLVGPPQGGLTEIWKSVVLGDEETFTAKAPVLAAAERSQAVASTPAALTYLALNESRSGIKYLSIDGVPPTAPHVIKGDYPLRTPLLLVTREHPNAATQAFIRHFAVRDRAWRTDGLIFADGSTQEAPRGR